MRSARRSGSCRPPASPSSSTSRKAASSQAEIKSGVTRVDADDGKLAAAWVIGARQRPTSRSPTTTAAIRIDELAPGTYDVTFWQPPIASLARDGTWTYGAPIVVKRSVKIEGRTATLSVALPGR